MKAHAQEIERVADRLIHDWKDQKLAEIRVPEPKLRERIIAIVTAEMQVEDDLNKEVDRLLQKYEKQFDDGSLDRRKMFQMVKNQLAKERKIVL